MTDYLENKLTVEFTTEFQYYNPQKLSYYKKDKTFVGMASNLGLSPGIFPEVLEIKSPSGVSKLFRKQKEVMMNGDLKFVKYSFNDFTAEIYND